MNGNLDTSSGYDERMVPVARWPANARASFGDLVTQYAVVVYRDRKGGHGHCRDLDHSCFPAMISKSWKRK